MQTVQSLMTSIPHAPLLYCQTCLLWFNNSLVHITVAHNPRCCWSVYNCTFLFPSLIAFATITEMYEVIAHSLSVLHKCRSRAVPVLFHLPLEKHPNCLFVWCHPQGEGNLPEWASPRATLEGRPTHCCSMSWITRWGSTLCWPSSDWWAQFASCCASPYRLTGTHVPSCPLLSEDDGAPR